MIPGLVVALVAGLAAQDALAPARAAFARAEYDRAEALALAADRPPHAGAARYLVGLARFRAGRPAEALEALDAAALAADPPERGPWQFNRGACLYALDRLAEAEAAFLEAAALDPGLAATALADAGFAALDAGAPDRARALAARGRAVAAGPALALVEDLERALAGEAKGVDAAGGADGEAEARRAAGRDHEAGLQAFDDGHFDAARARFLAAVALDPQAGPSRIMAGASALRLGRRTDARQDLVAALALPLDPADARAARDYLDAASPGLAARGLGFEASVQAGAGLDDNVLQSGLGSAQERAPISSSRVRSAEATAGGTVAWRGRLTPPLVLEVGYGLDQVAYQAAAAEDYALQQHLLAAALEWTPGGGPLRLGLSATGQAALTGWSDLRGLQAAGGAGAWAALDWSDRAATRLDLEWTGKRALRAEFDHLTGQRLDLGLSQALHLAPVSLSGAVRLRSERLGALTQSVVMPVPPLVCGFGCLSQQYRIPYGYDAVSLSASAQAPLAGRLVLGLSGAWEARRYRADSVLLVERSSGGPLELDRRRRRDDRLSAALTAQLRLGAGCSLVARWEALRSWSNVARVPPGQGSCLPTDPGCHVLDYDDKNFTKQVAGLEARCAW